MYISTAEAVFAQNADSAISAAFHISYPEAVTLLMIPHFTGI